MGLKDKFDGKRKPSGKWMILTVGVVIAGVAGVGAYFYFDRDTESQGNASSMAITPKKEDLEVGGAGSVEYNNRVIEQAHLEAEKASQQGKSFAPAPVSNTTKIDIADEPSPPRPQPQQNPQQAAQEVAAMRQQIKVSLEGIIKGMELSPQTTMTFVKPETLEAEQNIKVAAMTKAEQAEYEAQAAAARKPKLPGGIHAGSILYAVNDLKLNSDGKNTVVRATVISGPLKDYAALGAFDNSPETMSITFSRLVSPTGKEFPIKGFGVDPGTAETNVASDVDHHYLSRWGGFLAASFLQGFADATRLSGVSTGGFNSGYPGTPAGIVGYGFSTFPEYSLADKGIIAAGEAGRMAAQELKDGVRRPPTVTLDSGVAIGILIVSANGE